MDAHMTGRGIRERRSKGTSSKPVVYLIVEMLLLMLIVYLISFAEIKLLTVISALVAIYIFIMSCMVRYRRIKARQEEHKVYNSIHEE